MTFWARAMGEAIGLRLQELKQRSFNELAQLAGYQGERVRKEGISFTLSVWKDAISDHEVRVVVQAYRHWLLGIGSMAAQGFVIDSSGMVRDLSPEELYDFI